MVGPIEIGRRFIAITDPGSKMQHLSEADGFRRIFFGQPTIGGRFSVLSDFGMVPAAIMGLDVARLLGQAEQMAHSCAASVPVTENPGLMLGVLMGVAARQGRTKVTLIASPGAQALGTWIEQLMSASLGKTGGLLAIEGEPVGAPASYGSDRLFVYLRFDPAPDVIKMRRWRRWRRPACRWSASRWPIPTSWAASSSAGSSPRRWPVRCSA